MIMIHTPGFTGVVILNAGQKYLLAWVADTPYRPRVQYRCTDSMRPIEAARRYGRALRSTLEPNRHTAKICPSPYSGIYFSPFIEAAPLPVAASEQIAAAIYMSGVSFTLSLGGIKVDNRDKFPSSSPASVWAVATTAPHLELIEGDLPF